MKNEMKLNNKGFSLVELIVVIAIMAILVGVLAPSVLGQLDKAKISKDKQAIETVCTAIATAYADQMVTGTKDQATAAAAVTFITTGTPAAITDTDVTSFTGAIQDIVGASQVLLESSEFKDATITITLTDAGKVTAKATGTKSTVDFTVTR
ncbi:MAG: type II secretion system protein [Lachnospiraceae bacterium]